jgi:peptidoglycan glycosyltransferase
MNRPLRKVAVATLLMFAALLINANVVQVVQAHSLANDSRNSRLIYQQYSHQRGPIVVAGKPVAKSVVTPGAFKYLRVYPQGPLYAPATGYYSLTYRFSGIEAAENDLLSGASNKLFVKRLSDYFTGREVQGGAVVLTLNPRAQQTAYEQLTSHHYRGAVVAIQPTTGAILALVSTPSYDPSRISTHDSTANTKAWKSYLRDPDQPMLDRAISQTYPPGSTFKVITTAAALSTGSYTPDTVIPAPDRLTFADGKPLGNFAGETCSSSGKMTLRDALRQSCNTAYGALGVHLGSNRIVDQAEAFGVGRSLSIPMPVVGSRVPRETAAPFEAQEAIGQHDDAVTPLQMAMVAAGIANGGEVMKPYLVAQERAPDSSVLSQASPQPLSRAVSPIVARELTSMMETVVSSGTGTAAQIPGVVVAGKTGTAQHGGASPYAWFISFAPASNPTVAIAVVVENTQPKDTGGVVAAPIARAVMQAVLAR